MKLFEIDALGVISDVAEETNTNYATGGRSLIVLPGENGLDIFAGNESGANFFFENQGDGTFRERAADFGVDDRYETVRGVATLDANEDGRMDLVYGKLGGPSPLFHSQRRWQLHRHCESRR